MKKTAQKTSPPHLSLLLKFSIAVFVTVLVGSIASIVIATQVWGWHLFRNSNHQLTLAPSATIEGTLHFTGLKPDKGDKGEVKLFARQLDSTQPLEDTGTMIPLEQDARWSWAATLPGMNYQLQAVLIIDNKEVKRSEPVVVTAPADTVTLPLEVTWKDLPEDVVATSAIPMSGEVTTNGYLPKGSVLQIVALNASDTTQSFPEITPEVINRGQVVATLSSVQPSNAWSWSRSTPLQEYKIVAVLKQGSQIIGNSDQILTANAGDTNADLTVNSTAQLNPPTEAAPVQSPGIGQRLGITSQHTTISGTVYLNGPKQANTSLLVLWRKPGDQNYNVIGRYNYPAHGGTAWQWDEAEVGQQYQITAVIQVNEQNTSSAPNPVTVTAPATQVNFTLNTYYVIPATTGVPVLQTCLRKDSDNWNAIITLPKVQGAGNYWIGVGNASGQTNVFSEIFPAGENQSDPKVTVVVQNNRQHFMQYSYATCVHCDGQQNLAPPSAQVAFTCQ